MICVFLAFHQWAWNDQVLSCKRLEDVLVSSSASQVVGCQIDNVKAFRGR